MSASPRANRSPSSPTKAIGVCRPGGEHRGRRGGDPASPIARPGFGWRNKPATTPTRSIEEASIPASATAAARTSHQLDRVGGIVEIRFGVDDLGATHDDGRSSGNGHSRRVGASALLGEVSCRLRRPVDAHRPGRRGDGRCSGHRRGAMALAPAPLGATLRPRPTGRCSPKPRYDRSPGRRVLADVFDVRDAESVESFMARVADELGPIDILVNNVGGGSTPSSAACHRRRGGADCRELRHRHQQCAFGVGPLWPTALRS